jgi:hypothetical protein
MTDLRETSQIDKVGWRFAVAVLVITAVAAIVSYQGWEATVAQRAHIAASR